MNFNIEDSSASWLVEIFSHGSHGDDLTSGGHGGDSEALFVFQEVALGLLSSLRNVLLWKILLGFSSLLIFLLVLNLGIGFASFSNSLLLSIWVS